MKGRDLEGYWQKSELFYSRRLIELDCVPLWSVQMVDGEWEEEGEKIKGGGMEGWKLLAPKLSISFLAGFFEIDA